MDRQVILSVIIPVYNAERYLPRCLNSVLVQSYTDYEVILINDGSSDNSGKICDAYALKDSRIVVVHKQNEGVSKARNIGIQKSRSEYIMFLDADDYLERNCLEQFMRFSDNDLVICAYNNHNRQTNIYGPESFEVVNVETDIPKLWEQAYIPYWLFVWGKLYKSNIIKQNQLYFDTEMRYLEDFCFVLKYLTIIDHVCLTKDVLVNHIVEPTKYSKYTMTFEGLKKHMQINEYYFTMLEKKCGMHNFIKMREGIAYRHFFNFLYYLKIANVPIKDKIIEVRKFQTDGKDGLFKYIKIPSCKLRLFWMFWKTITSCYLGIYKIR